MIPLKIMSVFAAATILAGATGALAQDIAGAGNPPVLALLQTLR